MATLRDEITKRIERKRVEIADLDMKIREAGSYIQGLEEALKLLPKDQPQNPGEATSQALRAGSVVAKAREAILVEGKPLHITDILKALGKTSADNATRAAVSGSIAAYVRRSEVFTRPAPNTFGLIELPVVNKTTIPPAISGKPSFSQPPEDFGAEPDSPTEEEDDQFGVMDITDDRVPF